MIFPPSRIQISTLNGPRKARTSMPPAPTTLAEIARDAYVLEAHARLRVWRSSTILLTLVAAAIAIGFGLTHDWRSGDFPGEKAARTFPRVAMVPAPSSAQISHDMRAGASRMPKLPTLPKSAQAGASAAASGTAPGMASASSSAARNSKIAASAPAGSGSSAQAPVMPPVAPVASVVPAVPAAIPKPPIFAAPVLSAQAAKKRLIADQVAARNAALLANARKLEQQNALRKRLAEQEAKRQEKARSEESHSTSGAAILYSAPPTAAATTQPASAAASASASRGAQHASPIKAPARPAPSQASAAPSAFQVAGVPVQGIVLIETQTPQGKLVRPVRAGGILPDGEKLISADPATGNIVTSKRTIHFHKAGAQ